MFQILLLIAILGVIKAAIEVTKTYTCPEDIDLKKVSRGLERNADRKAEITRHLGHCGKCRAKIEQFQNQSF